MKFDDLEPAAAQAPLDTRHASEMTVGRIIKRAIVDCPPDTPLYEAARRMAEAGVSSILVVDGDRPAGIWTERDALRVDFGDPRSLSRPVREAMSAPVRTVSVDLGLQRLAARFRDERVRHFLVVDAEGRPCGLVSQTDVVLNQGIEHYLHLRQVGAVLKGHAPTLAETASLGAATALMREKATDAVVVAYADGAHGILTERDVARLLAQRRTAEAVGRLASRPLLTVDEDASLYRVRGLLAGRGIRHIGVVRADGGLAGVVSFADILSGMELAYIEELQLALRERDAALDVSQRHLQLAEKIIERSLEGILVTDAEARIVSVNPAFSRLTGYCAEEVLGKNPSFLHSGRHDAAFYAQMWAQIAREGHWQGEIWNRRKDGGVFPELITITAITDGEGRITNYAALFSDISALKESEAEARHLAYYDALTGLPNRRLLEDRLRVALAHAHRNGTLAAVVFVDLDRFKAINDNLGHEVGDRLLAEVARRLVAAVREDDTVARLGGDEFVLVLSELAGREDATRTAERLVEALREPLLTDGHALAITASIGVSLYPDDGETPAALLKRADLAMYRVKSAGRDGLGRC